MKQDKPIGVAAAQALATDIGYAMQTVENLGFYPRTLPKGYEMTITPQPWISVSDQMPQDGVRCIIATRVPGRYVIDGEPKDGHEIEFGEWTGDRWKCFSIPCVSIMHPSMVSHWMPMPETPVPRPY